jgi:hypothetical protein
MGEFAGGLRGGRGLTPAGKGLQGENGESERPSIHGVVP